MAALQHVNRSDNQQKLKYLALYYGIYSYAQFGSRKQEEPLIMLVKNNEYIYG